MTTRIAVLAVAICTTTTLAAADPPERVARISFVTGAASFRAAAATEWAPATLNYPVTIGDHLWTDRQGRLELEMGATVVDLDATSAMSVLNLDHHIVQLRLVQGTAIARVRELAADESVELDTPNGAVTLVRPGLYRVDVLPTGDGTTVSVRRGDAEITAGAAAIPLHAGQTTTLSRIDAPVQAQSAAVPLDEFEDWALFRDRRVDAPATVRYVPRGVVGYDDLDEFGAWSVAPEYGPVWIPRVRPGWAPYHFGHWAWVEPWGWTWVDEAPWGFAPFHYGRWAYLSSRWVWVPGAVVAQPVYAPALVAFVGAPGWRVGVNVGAPIGWFPLGPREVYVPAYAVAPAYVVAINRPHVSVTTVNINVTNISYVNRGVPGAVTVVSRETFVRARPVAAAAVAVAPHELAAAVVVGHAAPREVAPVAVVRSTAVVAPPPSVAARTVVVRRPPPAAASAGTAAPAAVAAPMPRPSNTTAASSPAAAQPPQPARPVPARVGGPGADRAGALAARHAQERADIEARHASEREALRARQASETPHGGRGDAEIRARHARERAELDARHKREREQMEQRQAAERRRQ